MSTSPPRTGLRLDQAPPLQIPLTFFLTAPVFMLAAGVLLCAWGPSMISSRYLPETIAFTHLATLGMLTMVMFGALYQMTPVVAASAVPGVGFARVVHAALVTGIATLAVGVMLQTPLVLYLTFAALGLAWLGFVIPVGLALWRSPAGADATVIGMRLAVAILFFVGVLGIWIAHGHAGMRFPGPRAPWMSVHLGLGLLGWVGGLITAVSFQVVPMFHLTPALSEASKRALLLAIGVSAGLGLAGLGLASVLDENRAHTLGRLLPLAFVPAAAAVWFVHPLLTLRAIAQRRRKRADASLRFWKLGLWLGPVAALFAGAAITGDDPRAAIAFGWLCLWGWALLIVHGMLYRIVPFLVWLHRIAHLVGKRPVPSAAKLLPEAWPRQAFVVHVAMLASGTCAIALGSPGLARFTGVLLAGLALHLMRSLWHLARYEPPTAGRAV